MTPDIVCPDCGQSSGDDWAQCEPGLCPMPMSPHFGKPADTIEDLDARCGRPLTENPCSICGLPIMGGAFVGTGDGTMRNGGSFAHIDCWRAAQGQWRGGLGRGFC